MSGEPPATGMGWGMAKLLSPTNTPLLRLSEGFLFDTC